MTPGNRLVWIVALALACSALPSAEAGEKAALPDAPALYRKGLQAMAAREWTTAVDSLEAAAAAAPDDLLIGTDYRQAVIGAAAQSGKIAPYERCLAFFEKVVTEHPSANAYLNYGFAHVDKIPAEGAITQVILANRALDQFGKALQLEESWLGYYSRGHAYLYWPPIFGRVELGLADLEKAVAISRKKADQKPYYASAWAALGDAYWRKDDVEQAHKIWKEALALYPRASELKERDSRSERAELDAFLQQHYSVGARVATHLNEIYTDRLAKVSSK